MVIGESEMSRLDPSSEKENLVPRVHRSELGSGGPGSVRTRGLTNSEHRSSSVLKESSLQNQTPAAVTLGKANLGSVEKDRLKNASFDYYTGKHSAGSLERIREKIGQLKSVGALKQPSPKTTSSLEQHSVGESNNRGLTSNGSEGSVQVYRDDKMSNSAGLKHQDSLKLENLRRRREMVSKIEPLLVPEHAKSSLEQVHDESVKIISPSTPTKSSNGKENESLIHSRASSFSRSSNGTPFKKKLSASEGIDSIRQPVQNIVEREGQLANEKQPGSSLSVDHDKKSIVDQDLKIPTANETARHASPALPSSVVDKIIKRAKCSRYGPALRVRRDDPRAYHEDDQSPNSEKSADTDQQSPTELLASKLTDSHGNNKAKSFKAESALSKPEAGPVSTYNSNRQVMEFTSLQAGEDLNDHRKRKAETDPSTTDTSVLLTGAVAMEEQEVINKGGNYIEHDRGRESAVKDARTEMTASEQSRERSTEDGPGHLLTGSSTKGTPGTEREPSAWKTARDVRTLAMSSPTLHEHSKSGKGAGSREPGVRRTETSGSPGSDSHKTHGGFLKQPPEVDKHEANNGIIPQPSSYGKGLASTDDIALNHLSNTFSTISIGEKSASGSSGVTAKNATQGRTPPQVSGHHMQFVPENGSLTGVTGVTGLTALTSQTVGALQKTAISSSHGIDLQQRPHSLQVMKERDHDRGTELPDRHGQIKSTTRSIVTSVEIPVRDGHEGHSAKTSEVPKERGEKNQENPLPNPQPPRKVRTETENDNFVYVNGTRYQKLGRIGKGGSSEVFKVIASNCSIYALKRINLKGRDWSTAKEFYQEIKYLKALRGKRHIIQLVDSEITNKKVLEKRWEGRDIMEDAVIYMVLEYGEIDLAGMLAAKRKEMQMDNESKLDENWLRFYWQQILAAVRTIHDERIVHSDLKPANFMLVKGELKLIDFGIAKAIQNDTTNIVRDSQAGTLNYMSPEACLQNQTDEDGLEIKQGRPSDIWSLGCILYQMVYGQTPFAELSFYSKIQAITNPHHKINYPAVSNPWLLDIMKKCLIWDRRKRLRIPELLEHPFLQPHLAPYCARCEQVFGRSDESRSANPEVNDLDSYQEALNGAHK